MIQGLQSLSCKGAINYCHYQLRLDRTAAGKGRWIGYFGMGRILIQITRKAGLRPSAADSGHLEWGICFASPNPNPHSPTVDMLALL